MMRSHTAMSEEETAFLDRATRLCVGDRRGRCNVVTDLSLSLSLSLFLCINNAMPRLCALRGSRMGECVA